MYNMLIWYDILIFFKMIITITLTPPSRHIITVSFFMWECLRATFLATFQYIVQYRSNCQHLLDHQKRQENSRKTSISALLTIPKSWTVWNTTNCGKFLQRWEYQTTWSASWEICMQVRKQQNWTWNNRLVPNRKRSTSRLYIVTLLI